jgi:hypothetical protein
MNDDFLKYIENYKTKLLEYKLLCNKLNIEYEDIYDYGYNLGSTYALLEKRIENYKNIIKLIIL